MPRYKYLKSGELSEESMHKTVIEWVTLQPLIARLVMHFPNEGKRSPRYGKLLKDLGMRPGVADLFIAMGKHDCLGAWIELKTSKGVVSPEQKAFLSAMEQQGYFTTVCRSIEDTIDTIKWYCWS